MRMGQKLTKTSRRKSDYFIVQNPKGKYSVIQYYLLQQNFKKKCHES